MTDAKKVVIVPVETVINSYEAVQRIMATPFDVDVSKYIVDLSKNHLQPCMDKFLASRKELMEKFGEANTTGGWLIPADNAGAFREGLAPLLTEEVQIPLSACLYMRHLTDIKITPADLILVGYLLVDFDTAAS